MAFKDGNEKIKLPIALLFFLIEYQDKKILIDVGCDKMLFDNVEIKHIGGHSPGSCIVLIRMNEKNYVLCGDECYTVQNLLQKKPTWSSYCAKKVNTL